MGAVRGGRVHRRAHPRHRRLDGPGQACLGGRLQQTRLVPPSTIQSFRDAAWSPDGRSFVAAAASGELWVFDAEDYVTRALPVPTGAGLRSVVFVDPQHVLVGSDDGELVIVDVSVAVMDLPGQLKEARKRIERAEAAGIG